MLRVSHLRSSLPLAIPTIPFCISPSPFSSSPSTIHTFSSSLSYSSSSSRFTPTSKKPFHFYPFTMPHPCPKATPSYSTGSSAAERGRELLVQHLLVKEDNQKLILDLQQRISTGEDLSDLAVEYSICPSKEEGGMLGWVRKGQMVPEFEEAAFNAPLNKVVRCKTKFGWHLLQVLSEREEALLQDIQPDEFHVKIQDPNFLEEAQLIDVREPGEVAKASLPGFKVLPLQQFGSWGPEITTKFDPQKDTYVMVPALVVGPGIPSGLFFRCLRKHCHHGVRSLQVAKWLQSQGFRKIYNLSGGIHAYSVQVDPSVPTY